MLQGMRPNDCLSDLEVIRELVKKMRDDYPHGVDFKLRKETLGTKHKDEIIRQQVGQVELLSELLAHDKLKRQFKTVEEFWEEADKDADVHDELAYGFNSGFAKRILVNGFRCKVDGSLKLKFDSQALHKHASDLRSYSKLLSRFVKYVTRFLDSCALPNPKDAQIS